MVPTIGRIVHYHPTADEAKSWGTDGQPCAAIVTRLNPDASVNLTLIIDQRGGASRTAVPMGDAAGSWSWPPKVEEPKPAPAPDMTVS